ncbi:MAG: MraY family glycosyltransferase, partial [Candidatus Firestonebacteria bacterium]
MIKKTLYFISILGVICLLLPSGGAWFFVRNLPGIHIFLLAFLLAVVLTPLAIKAAFKFKILDRPNKRKMHLKPVPRLGGAAVFTAFLISAAAASNYYFSKEVTGIIAGLALVFIVELLDDIKSNSVFLRLGAQVGAVIILIVSGVHISVFPVFPGSIYLNYLLTFVWVVGIINAVNYLDGLDGLAAGMGIISSLSFFAVIYLSVRPE